MASAQTAPLTPRVIDKKRLAGYIGKSPSWLSKHLARLQTDEGFPSMLESLKGWDRLAVDAWVDERSQGKTRGRKIGTFK